MVAQKAEVYNGRLAMVAFALLIVRPASVCTDLEFCKAQKCCEEVLLLGQQYAELCFVCLACLVGICRSGW